MNTNRIFCINCKELMNQMDSTNIESKLGENNDLETCPNVFVCPKCGKEIIIPDDYKTIEVEDFAWGISRATGKKNERSNGIILIPLVEDLSIEIGVQQIRLTVSKISNDSVSLIITPRNEAVEPIKFTISKKTKEYTYRPRSFDGGHYYIFKYNVKDNYGCRID